MHSLAISPVLSPGTGHLGSRARAHPLTRPSHLRRDYLVGVASSGPSRRRFPLLRVSGARATWSPARSRRSGSRAELGLCDRHHGLFVGLPRALRGGQKPFRPLAPGRLLASALTPTLCQARHAWRDPGCPPLHARSLAWAAALHLGSTPPLLSPPLVFHPPSGVRAIFPHWGFFSSGARDGDGFLLRGVSGLGVQQWAGRGLASCPSTLFF
jgi:hypothetical protein